MGETVQAWLPTVKIPSTLMHAVAILTTIFRLLHRWYLSRFWWEDAWATLALLSDMACLAAVWMQTAPTDRSDFRTDVVSNWIRSTTLTSVVWFSRISILCSIVRIVNPNPKLRRISYCIGILFFAMQAGLLGQKIFMCAKMHCWLTRGVAIAQLVTDIISDAILVAASVRFLRDVKLTRNRRILILSAFSASILISIVTIFHSILLFQAATNTTVVIGHAKAALALLVCNALVLATFVYRLFQKSVVDLESSMTERRDDGYGSHAAVFTSFIDLPGRIMSHVLPMSHDQQSKEDAALAQ